MPSNLQLNVGVGGALTATKQVTHDGDSVQMQGISILGVSGVEDAYTIADIGGTAANGLEVDVTRVQGTVTVDGSAVIQPVHDENLISTDNSSTTPLGIGASFVGVAEDISQYSAISVILAASHDSAVDGMQFQFSPDGTNWDETHFFTLTASTEGRHFQFPAHAQWFRVNYENGGTAQTSFRVQTILHAHNIGTSIHRLVDDTSPDRSATVVKAAIIAQAAGTGNFVPVQASAIGNLKMSIEEINGSVEGGGIEATALRVTMANDSTGLLSIDDNGGSLTVDTVADAVDGIAHGASQTGFRAMGTDGSSDQQIAVSSSGFILVSGNTSHGLIDSANPIKVGGRANAALFTAVDEGDRVDASFDLQGQLRITNEVSDPLIITDDGNAILVDGSAVTQPVSAASLPLPTGAATSANQLADGHNVTVDNAVGSPANVQIGDGTDQAQITALAENVANPTALEVGAFIMGFDGATWDRLRVGNLSSDANGSPGGGALIEASYNLIYNGATWDRMRGDITNGLDVDVTRTPADGIDGAAHGASQVGFRMMGSDGTNDSQVLTDGGARLISVGSIGHDGADSHAPVKIGGHATAAPRTAVGEADRTDASFDLQGQARTISGVTTSGGASKYKNLDVDNTEDAVKTSAGQIYWIHCINLGSAVRYLKFYDDTIGNVIVGTTVPDLTFPIPTQGDSNGAGFTLTIPGGIPFGTAITVAATTGFADNDAVDPGDNEVILNLGFA